MVELKVTGATLPAAYHQALKQLSFAGELASCPDWHTTQLECSMTMVVYSPLKEPMISKCFIGGPRELEQYRQEMLDGILDWEVERGKWAYTYHQRMAEQIPFVISELRRNPWSRRAVIDIRDWRKDTAGDDPACLQHIQYFIRDGLLDCCVLFRSNDACKAAFMNAFALIMLQKRVADELGVQVGSYTHRANSFHVYERDLPLLEGYLARIDAGDAAYNYAGDWDELMAEARPDIAAMVEELRAREG